MSTLGLVDRKQVGVPRSTGTPPARPLPRLLHYPFTVRIAIRRWRSMLGLVIGVGIALGLVMAMMGDAVAAMGGIVGDFPQSGANVYVYVNGGHLVPLTFGSVDSPGTIQQASSVLSTVRGMPRVRAAIGEFTASLQEGQEGPQARNQAEQFIMAVGVDGDPSQIPNMLVLDQGRWLRRRNEVVLGRRLSADKSLGIGDSLKMNGQEFQVVGIGKLRGFGQSGNSVAYLDGPVLRQRADVGDVLNFIAIQTSAPQTVSNAVSDFRGLRAIGRDELEQETLASSDYMANIESYWLINVFILLVAGMFVSNVLGRSVAERRIEFGTLRAIGMPRKTMLLSVAAEGLLVILVAYVVGVAVSLPIGGAMNVWLAPALHFDSLYTFDPPTYLTILVLTLVLGVAASILPARQATTVDPLEVLREV